MGHAFVDLAAVQEIANQFAATAEIIDGAARTSLSQLTFGGGMAGRTHVARGDALRVSLDRLAGELSQWSLATREVVAALQASADSYADAEVRSAARIG